MGLPRSGLEELLRGTPMSGREKSLMVLVGSFDEKIFRVAVLILHVVRRKWVLGAFTFEADTKTQRLVQRIDDNGSESNLRLGTIIVCTVCWANTTKPFNPYLRPPGLLPLLTGQWHHFEILSFQNVVIQDRLSFCSRLCLL